MLLEGAADAQDAVLHPLLGCRVPLLLSGFCFGHTCRCLGHTWWGALSGRRPWAALGGHRLFQMAPKWWKNPVPTKTGARQKFLRQICMDMLRKGCQLLRRETPVKRHKRRSKRTHVRAHRRRHKEIWDEAQEDTQKGDIWGESWEDTFGETKWRRRRKGYCWGHGWTCTHARRRYSSERTGAVGSPCQDRETP